MLRLQINQAHLKRHRHFAVFVIFHEKLRRSALMRGFDLDGSFDGRTFTSLSGGFRQTNQLCKLLPQELMPQFPPWRI